MLFLLLAAIAVRDYAATIVKPPFINVEENIDRFVGWPTTAPDAWETGMKLQSLGVELHQTFKHRWMPKGVYRFKTHEEADAWMNKMMARANLPTT